MKELEHSRVGGLGFLSLLSARLLFLHSKFESMRRVADFMLRLAFCDTAAIGDGRCLRGHVVRAVVQGRLGSLPRRIPLCSYPAGGLLGWVTPRLRWGQRGGKQCGLTAMHVGTAHPQQWFPGLVSAQNHLRGFRTAADHPPQHTHTHTHTHARTHARTLPSQPIYPGPPGVGECGRDG